MGFAIGGTTVTGLAIGATPITGFAIGATVFNLSWAVSGGVEQITITAMPTVAAPVVSGGVEQLTVTG